MGFFNSKLFTITETAYQTHISIGQLNYLHFYIKDIFLGTEIATLDYTIIKSKGRSTSIIESDTTTVSAEDTCVISFTPPELTADETVRIIFKITDVDGDEHIVPSPIFTGIQL